jgi:3',5'-nucleoside bisphosphate phosphatase
VSERFDFHTHTRVSDGSLTPTELVERAAANKVTGFALTDHDTVGGVAEARAAAAAHGIELMAGIEISVSENDGKRGLHVLGLGIDDASPALLGRLDELQRGREGRAARIVAHLQRAGIDITLAQVETESGGGAIGRPHVARALVAVGACKDVDDAFTKFLRRGKVAFEPNTALSAGEAIALVHAAGGVAVLAHPPLSAGVDGPGGLAAFVERLLPLGLDGLELWHPSHKATTVRKLGRIARAHGLLETGGSDFHGADRPDVEIGRGRFNKLHVGRAVRDALELRIAQRRAALGLTAPGGESNLGRPV